MRENAIKFAIQLRDGHATYHKTLQYTSEQVKRLQREVAGRCDVLERYEGALRVLRAFPQKFD